MLRRTCRRWYHHPAAQAAIGTVMIFITMLMIAAVLTYGPAVDAWSRAERDRTVDAWGR